MSVIQGRTLATLRQLRDYLEARREAVLATSPNTARGLADFQTTVELVLASHGPKAARLVLTPAQEAERVATLEAMGADPERDA